MIYGTEKEYIRHTLIKAGAVEAGFAEAAPVEEKFMHLYTSWIEEGCHSGMDYLRRHIPLKAHPRHVLEGAATVISTAFSYAPAEFRAPAPLHSLLRLRKRLPRRAAPEAVAGRRRVQDTPGRGVAHMHRLRPTRGTLLGS